MKLIHDRNILLDILSILPTIISQILYRFYLSSETEETHLFDYITCLKLVRLFRLTRYAKSLETLLEILYINRKDILRLTILVIFGTFYFGLTQFVLEQLYDDNEIHNIGEALWHVNTPFRTSSHTLNQPISLSGIYSDHHHWIFRYC